VSVRTADGPPRLVLRFALYSAIALLFASLGILWFVRHEAQQSAEHEVGQRARLIANGLSHNLRPSDFSGPVDGSRRAALDELIHDQLMGGVVRIKLWSPGGTVTYSNEHSLIGTGEADLDDLALALNGATVQEIGHLNEEGGSSDLKILEAYVPMYVEGSQRPAGVLEIYQDYGPVAADVRSILLPIALALGLALLGLWATLLPILRQVTRALETRSQRLAEQTRALQQTLREREQAETNLREAEAGYQALVEQLPLAIYIRGLNVRTSNMYVSPQVEPMLGYPAEQWRTDPDLIKTVIHPDDLDRVLAELAEVRRTGEPLRTEYRCIASDGRIVWVEDLTFVVRDDHGKPQYVQGFLLDITERKRAEESVTQSEEKFRTLVANVPGVVFRCEIDADWTMRFISDAVEEISGYPAEDFIDNRKRTFTSIVHPDDVGPLARTVEQAVAAGRSYITEYRIRTRDGEVRWVLERGQAVSAPDGHLVLDGAIFDVTERKTAAEEVAKLAAIVESSDDAIMAASLDGVITSWNSGAEQVFGYSAAEILGKPITILAPADHAEEPTQLLSKAADGQGVVHHETVRKRKDGKLIDVSLTISPLRDVAGNIVGASAIARDITERKRAEAERERLLVVEREQNERLRELDRLKDEFVALVSHELRTPLTSIRGYLELVLDGEGGELTEEQRQFLGVVERNADRLLALVGDLLFLAQIEAGKLSLEFGAVDLGAVASESVDAARPLADEKEITLSLAVGPVPLLAGDAARIGQLVDNLVSNALKFTPEGGRVDVRAQARNSSAVIEVRDSGIGIPAEEQERLFERFFRSSNATERQIQGTGLGLAISKAIVEAHGGEIAVSSELGVGTTFRVSLPVHQPRAQQPHAEPVAL
jgi:two-component system, sensor histidine kinase and response regulator